MSNFFIIVLLRIFVAGGAQVAVQATCADRVLAGLTTAQAVITGRALARFAGGAAFIAERVITAGAAVRAAVTESGAAAIAGVFVVFRNRVATIGAWRAMPIGEPAIGGAGVVSPEDLGHEEKEFSQTPLFQCPGDRVAALAFAEGVALHVRVRDVVAASRATRIESNDLIRLITAESTQRKPDFERAEVNLFQNDAFRPDVENLGRPVEFNMIEFVLDGLQFLEQQSQRWRFLSLLQTFQIFGLMQAVFRQSTQ
ncbi:hypothetical protein [Planctomicrobium sp. SH527]|uniref:hypothetical protein n=1 Tax=Planctomicrobium sp. SH527 TaxID=3448123 RepID=UPI003F5C89A2